MKRKHTRRVRMLALLMTLLLIFASVPVQADEPETNAGVQAETLEGGTDNQAQEAVRSGYGMTVTLQIEGYSGTLEQGISVTMPDTYKTFADYGLEGIPEPAEPGYTVLHVMAEYCEQTYGSAEGLIEVGGGYVSGFLGLPEKSTLMFLLNHESIQVGAQEQKVQQGDLVSVVDIWANSTWTIGGQYGWFTQDAVTAEAGDTFAMQLNATPLMWGEASNPAGATVTVFDQTQTEAASGITGSDGTVYLSVDEPGTYTVTATRKSTYYDTDMSYPWDLVPAHGTVTILPEKEVTDKEAVERVRDSLMLGDLTQVTEDLNLPNSGKYRTQITWKSSDPSAIAVKGTLGKVTRPVGKDKTVTLTAEITRGNETVKKEFAATVAGKALFEALSVDQGTLSYDKTIDSYTLYVKQGVKKLTITGTVSEGVTVMRNGVYNQEGKQVTQTVMTMDSPQFTAVSCLTDTQGNDLTPQEITLEALGTTSGKVTITVKRGNPADPLPDLPHSWGQHLGNEGNNAVVDVASPYEDAGLLWESNADETVMWNSAGYPLLVDGKIYVARNQEIQMLDAQTGKLLRSTRLYKDHGWYSYITYGEGKIFVPVNDGSVQCFNAETLESLFVTSVPGLGLGYQGLSSIHYNDGMIYVGYTSGGSPGGSNGGVAAYETVDIYKEQSMEIVDPVWDYTDGEGFYGTGAITLERGGNTYVVIGGDDGKAVSLDAASGQVVDAVELDGAIRSSVVEAEDALWITTQGVTDQSGNIYKLTMNEDGTLEKEAEASLPMRTNASAVVAGGKVYVTGGMYKDGYLAVYDLDLKELARESIDSQVNTPTVTTAYGDTYVYFTQYLSPGSLYVAKVTADNVITVSTLYTPEHANYGMSNVVIGEDGTIYYGNDSGYLFAIGTCEKEPENPDDGEEPKPEEDPDLEGNPQEQKPGGETPVLTPPGGSPTSAAQVKKTSSTKSTKKKTKSESIAEAIVSSAKKGETSLTVRKIPDVLDAVVFQAMEEYPDFRLILDCGTYTISIQGDQIRNPEASLCTKLIEKDSSLSEAEMKIVGKHQQLELLQEGEFPGTLTIVYQLPEQLEGAEQLYLYVLDAVKDDKVKEEAVIQKNYAMFQLDEPGEYVLADRNESVDESEETAPVSTSQKIDEELIGSDRKAAGSKATWGLVAVGVIGGIVVGAGVTALILSSRRKKDSTWEE